MTTRPPSIRLKSRWFRSERPRGAREVAGAAAFIVWRIAGNVLASMRNADFEIPPGPRYFDFLAEWLVFLVQVSDRVIYTRFDAEQRFEFVCTLANRVAEILTDNRADLLGVAAELPVSAGKDCFIDTLNLRSLDYAEFRFENDEADYGFRRFLADRLVDVVGERDTVWVHDQVMEIEVPRAVELLRKGLAGLLDEDAPPARRRGVAVSGD